LFRAFFKHFGDRNDDKAVGLVLSCFFKELFVLLSDPEDIGCFLQLAEAELVGQCVDTLKDKAPFILDIPERAQAFLNFYFLVLRKCEKLDGDKLWASETSKTDFNKKYFSPLLNTVEAGFSVLTDNEKEAE